MQINEFLSLYSRLANNQANTYELASGFEDLKKMVRGTQFEGIFGECITTRVDMALAIDALAAKIHKNPELATEIFGACDIDIIKKELDQLSGLEDESDIRRSSRGFFSTIKSGDGFDIL